MAAARVATWAGVATGTVGASGAGRRLRAHEPIVLGAVEGKSPDPNDPATKACTPPPNNDYTVFLKKDGLKGARIGIPRASYFDKTRPPGSERDRGGLNPDQLKLMNDAIAVLKAQGAVVVDPADIPSVVDKDPQKNVLFSEVEAGSGIIETTHAPNADAIAIFGDSLLYVNLDECTSCTACYQPDVCPVGAIYSEDQLPDGSPKAKYNADDPNKGHDHTFFIQHSRDVFAD